VGIGTEWVEDQANTVVKQRPLLHKYCTAHREAKTKVPFTTRTIYKNT